MPHRDLAQQLRPGPLLLLEHLPEGFLVEVPHVDHDRAESSRHVELSVVSCPCAQGPSVIGSPAGLVGVD